MAANPNILGQRVAVLESYTAMDITALIALIDNVGIGVQKMQLSANYEDPKFEKMEDEIVDKLWEIRSRLRIHYRKTNASLSELADDIEDMKLDEKQRGFTQSENVNHYDGDNLEETHPRSVSPSETNDLCDDIRTNHAYHQSGETAASHCHANAGPNLQTPTHSHCRPAIVATKPRERCPGFDDLYEQARDSLTPRAKIRDRESFRRNATKRVAAHKQFDEIEREGGSHRAQLLNEQSSRFGPLTANYQRHLPDDSQQSLQSNDSSRSSGNMSENLPSMGVGGSSCLRGEFLAEKGMNHRHPRDWRRIESNDFTPPVDVIRYSLGSEAIWEPGAVLNGREPEIGISSAARRTGRPRFLGYWEV